MTDMARVAVKRKLGDSAGTLSYWRSRPVEERLAHLEALRAEFYGWGDEAGPRLHRVHRLLRRS
ncbi:MAG: hypothetical protein ACRDY7_02435 [Acidimicrobiia bacterium]